MEYNTAISKSWEEFEKLAKEKSVTVEFFNDSYNVDIKNKSITSLSCNIPAKPYLVILILHYLIKKLAGLPRVKDEWISFNELVGGPGYYPTFKKRVIDVIKRKYSPKPDALFDLIERFKGKKTQLADISIILKTFENVPILINFWRGDEEFGPEANVLFDKTIQDIFCTEDIVVLSEIITHSI